MKNLFALIALVLAFAAPTFAQETIYPSTNRASNVELSDEELMEGYDRILRNQFKVDMRAAAIEDLSLTKEETTKFSNFWIGYEEELARIDRKRTRLIKNYREEMAEDDSAEDKEEERADFIEDYWETNIDAMEVRKDAFDRLEDLIGTDKALRFFVMEESYANQVARMRLQKLFENNRTVIFLSPMNMQSENSQQNMRSLNDSQPQRMETPKRMYKEKKNN